MKNSHYTLHWIKKIDEKENRSPSETKEILNELDLVENKAINRSDLKAHGKKVGAILACNVPLALAGFAMALTAAEVGTPSWSNPLVYVGTALSGAGTLGLLAGITTAVAISCHADKIQNQARQKRQLIKEIAQGRGYQVEEVEDEIQ